MLVWVLTSTRIVSRLSVAAQESCSFQSSSNTASSETKSSVIAPIASLSSTSGYDVEVFVRRVASVRLDLAAA